MKRFFPSVLAAAMFFGAVASGSTCADIDNFNWIDERIASGGQPTLEQISSLKREGFRTIIDLREPTEYDAASEAAEARRLGLGYVSIPFRTADPKDEQAAAFLAAMRDRTLWPVFAHCGSGNRVAALWMIHRVLVDRWDLADAEREARVIGLKSANLREFAHEYICRHAKSERGGVPCSNGGVAPVGIDR
jgi:uncharacterized protein (TIGR01244 family)